MQYPLTVAGSDPSGGAGVQLDVRVFSGEGLHPLSVITCLTAQNQTSFKVAGTVGLDAISAQLDSLLAGFDVGAAKTGLLHSPDVVRLVAERLGDEDFPLVVDPVLSSTVQGDAPPDETVAAYREKLVPMAHVLTPNVPEAEALLGRRIASEEDMRFACVALCERGAANVVLKGGHAGGRLAVDLLFDGEEFRSFQMDRIPGSHHGTGCLFSAHMVTSLVKGIDVAHAVASAKRYVHDAMLAGFDAGGGLTFLDLKGRGIDPVTSELLEAVRELEMGLPVQFLPEVGINIGYARPGATSSMDVCALTGRIHRVGSRAYAIGTLEYGASRHIARIILSAMEKDPDVRAACNIRYQPWIVEIAEERGMTVSSFDRSEEPDDASSMEWGTRTAIENTDKVPDMIYDRGDVGKEAMIRVLGARPGEVVGKVLALAEWRGLNKDP